VPLQLSIRDNRYAAGFGFRAHQTCTFEKLPVSIGSSAACYCQVEDADVEGEFFSIRDDQTNSATYTLAANEETENTVYVNHRPVSGTTTIRNGDEIRVKHWTFRFFRTYPLTRFSRKAGMLSVCAKVLVALIFLGEIAFAVYLPRQLHAAKLWQEEILEQKTLMLLDKLKRRSRPKNSAEDGLAGAGQSLIQQAIKKRTAFVRKNREKMSTEQWARMRQDLLTYEQLLRDIRRGEAWQAIPELKPAEGVKSLLQTAEEKTLFSSPAETNEQ